MKNLQRLSLIGLSLALVLVPFLPVGAQGTTAHIRITQVDNSKFPQITLYVSVTDNSGEPLAVNPSQIKFFENGKKMKPTQISGSGDIGPLTTLLVMDVSGSMNNAGKLSEAKAAAQAYVDQMRPGDQAGLLTFNTKVTYVQNITSDHAALSQAIKNLKAENDTAMFDALAQADTILQGYAGRKAIILLTDGLDNQSKTTAKQIIQSTSNSGLSISAIGLGNPDNAGPFFGLDETALRSLAEKAGGVYSYAANPADLSNLFEEYGRALQSEYRITYITPSTLRDGIGRQMTVSLNGTVSDMTKYNPGGVLPEVTSPAPWTIFLGIFVFLIFLLFMPGIINRFLVRKPAKVIQEGVQKSESHIRLK